MFDRPALSLPWRAPHRIVQTCPARLRGASCSPWRNWATRGRPLGGFELTPRVLDLGMSYVLSRGLWEIARPGHMEQLVARTRESSSVAQLDGSDIVYVARVAVPKIVTLVSCFGLCVSCGKAMPLLIRASSKEAARMPFRGFMKLLPAGFEREK